MLFQYLNGVFNIQSQHGIWKMLQHLLPNTEKMDYSWLTVLYFPVRLTKLVLLNTSDTVLYVRVRLHPMKDILEIALSYGLHEASYWGLILIECFRYWLLHALAADRVHPPPWPAWQGLVKQAKGEGALGQQFGWIMHLRTESRSQNTPCNVCQFPI